MKIIFLTSIMVLVGLSGYAQTSFEPGYYIANDGNRIEGFIKNVDWRSNPTKFRYKPTETSNIQIQSIQDIKELGIGLVVYKRFNVQIDKASDVVRNLDKYIEPVFKKETLFLKVLIEGTANLYKYQQNNLTRYFFSSQTHPIEQLVYKRYAKEDGTIGYNNQFIHQLFEKIKCEPLSILDVRDIEYTESDLRTFFVTYNTCKDPNYVNQSIAKRKGEIKITLRAGVNFASMDAHNRIAFNSNTTFDRKATPRIGALVEYVLPFNNKKWTVFIEPSYQSFNATGVIASGTSLSDLKYQSAQVSVGAKHNFYLTKTSKIFVNLGYMFDIPLNSKISFELGSTELELSTISQFLGGIGYNYNDKYSVEFRYEAKRNMLNSFLDWKGDYTSAAIILGYTVFTK